MTTLDVLRALEWTYRVDYPPVCPICRSLEGHPHRDGCDLKAAIDRELSRLAPAESVAEVASLPAIGM
jgi:hypothetical protein